MGVEWGGGIKGEDNVPPFFKSKMLNESNF
jgi:hypothetical protein